MNKTIDECLAAALSVLVVNCIFKEADFDSATNTDELYSILVSRLKLDVTNP